MHLDPFMNLILTIFQKPKFVCGLEVFFLEQPHYWDSCVSIPS